MTGWQAAYPRVGDGIVVVRVADGYIAEGGSQRELFTGRVARDVFPRLLPLLDGTRKVADIAADLDYTPASLWRLVELLSQRGLVQVLTQPAGQDRGSVMRVFLHRTVPGGRGQAAAERLRRAVVSVIGGSPITDTMADLLERSGIGSVRRDGDWPSPAAREGTPDLVIWTVAADSAQNRPQGPGTVPWLPVCVGTDKISVGPLLGVPGGACRHCFTDSRSGTGADGAPADDGPGHSGPGIAMTDEAALAGLGAGVAVGAALRYLGGYGASRTWHGVIEAWPDGRQVERVLGGQRRCHACRTAALPLTERELAELEYELSVEPPPWGGEMRTVESGHHQTRLLPKPYLTEPRLRARQTDGKPPVNGSPLLPALGWLLTHSVGARAVRKPWDAAGRPGWTPAVGPLGSINAYVLGELDSVGRGVYYFDASSREFVVLPASDRAADPAPSRSLTVVLTGDVSQVSTNFGPAARRAIYQDAGLAVAQLDACARACGWRVAARRGPAGYLDELLELPAGREIVAAVIDLVRDPAAGWPPAGSPPARLSARLRQPVTYRFRDEPVTDEAVRQIAGAGLAAAERIWRGKPDDGLALGCVVYARHVAAVPRGLYAFGAGSDLLPLGNPGEPGKPAAGMSLAETYLRDRELDPPALLLFTGDLAGTLAASGPAGYPALVAAAATAAGVARLKAAGAGLGAGLFARLPATGWLVSSDDPRAGHRVFCGCAIGHLQAQAPPQEPRCMPW